MRAKVHALAVVLLVSAACGGGDTTDAEAEPVPTAAATTLAPMTTVTTTAPTSTAPATTLPMSDLDRAREVIDSWNSLDVDTFLAHFSRAAVFDGYLAVQDDVRDQIGFYMALGDVTEVTECTYDARERAVCTAVTRDLLSGPAGQVHEGRWIFDFDDDGLVTVFSWSNIDNAKNEFIIAMVAWLETAHPELWEAAFSAGGRCAPGVLINCHTTWYATPEAGAALLELGPAFIEQSSRYSLQG